jgi:hypothetical protein
VQPRACPVGRREAADLEDRNEKHIVTPGRILPARELLGELGRQTATTYDNLAANLNAQGRHADARPLYQKTQRKCHP